MPDRDELNRRFWTEVMGWRHVGDQGISGIDPKEPWSPIKPLPDIFDGSTESKALLWDWMARGFGQWGWPDMMDEIDHMSMHHPDATLDEILVRVVLNTPEIQEAQNA